MDVMAQATESPRTGRPAQALSETGTERGPVRAASVRRFRKAARAGAWPKATHLLRAEIASGEFTPTQELRKRFRLLRLELATRQWAEALRSVDGLYARLSRRGIVHGPVVGWVHLARAVAQFQLGEGAKYRRSMAGVLWAVRRSRGGSVRATAIRIAAAVESLGRLPGEPWRVVSRLAGRAGMNGPNLQSETAARDRCAPPIAPEAALAAWLRGEGLRRPTHRSLRWSEMPSLLVGPSELRSGVSQAAVWVGRAPRSEEGVDHLGAEGDATARLLDSWLSGAAARPQRRLPAWVAAALSRLAAERIPEEPPPRREQLLAALSVLATRTREPWARAQALEALAEGRLWNLAPKDEPISARRTAAALVESRADLALAAGMFRKASWNLRADACERRWARLALPVLGPQVAEPALTEARDASAREGHGREASGSAASAPLDRAACGMARLSAGCEPDLGRVQRALAGEGFFTDDRRTLRELTPLHLLAATPLPVLILGESGTGKELLARALHRWSRLRGELVAIHCGAIPRDLLESELFGHARGAFTGAAGEKPGLIEAADGGTLFLDEIGEMGSEAQMKMLRVLESGEVRRLGELRPRRTALRLVAATHRRLDQEVGEGTFRLDLFHRIRGVVVRVRPLRERRVDIPLLAAGFLASARVGELRFSPEGFACLVAHSWPGNVRELRAVVQRAAHLARALGRAVLDPALLGLAPAAAIDSAVMPCSAWPTAGAGAELPGSSAAPGAVLAHVFSSARDCPAASGRAGYGADNGTPEPPFGGSAGDDFGGRADAHVSSAIPEMVRTAGLDAYLDRIERRIIVQALADHRGNRTHAARELGGISRTTLLGKIRRLRIDGGAPGHPGQDLRDE